MYIFSSVFLSELVTIIYSLEDEIPDIISEISGFVSRLHIGLLSFSIDAPLINSAAKRLLSQLLSLISPQIAGAIFSIPGTVISLLIFTVALFYMCAELKEVNRFFCSLLPSELRPGIQKAVARTLSGCRGLILAQLVLFSITFFQLFIGFLILKLPYPLTLAFLIAVIDILPVLGVGTVLVPWALILFLRQSTCLGLGLLILFFVIFTVHRIAEPKLVSKRTGISPLLSLFSIYLGAELIGPSGIILFPLLAVLLKNLFECGVFDS